MTEDINKLLPKGSLKAKSMRDIRSLAFHFIYAMEQTNYEESLESIVDNFKRGFDLEVEPDSMAIKIARSVIDEREALDLAIAPYLKNWKLERLGLCTRLILRMAIWELNQPEAIPSIVINEAIELSKDFAEKDAYKFINGVLDEMVNKKEKDGDNEEGGRE